MAEGDFYLHSVQFEDDHHKDFVIVDAVEYILDSFATALHDKYLDSKICNYSAKLAMNKLKKITAIGILEPDGAVNAVPNAEEKFEVQ